MEKLDCQKLMEKCILKEPQQELVKKRTNSTDLREREKEGKQGQREDRH